MTDIRILTAVLPVTLTSTVRALKTPLELITRVIDYLLEKYCAGCVLCSKL